MDIIQFRFIKTLRNARKQRCSFTLDTHGACASESIAIKRIASLEINIDPVRGDELYDLSHAQNTIQMKTGGIAQLNFGRDHGPHRHQRRSTTSKYHFRREAPLLSTHASSSTLDWYVCTLKL